MKRKFLAIPLAMLLALGTMFVTAGPAAATPGYDCVAGDSNQDPMGGEDGTIAVSGTYAGKDWKFLICLATDSNPAYNYAFLRIRYNGVGTVNENISGGNVIKSIEVDYMSLYMNTSFKAACDGDSGNRWDGGGCNDVVWNNDTTHFGTGPCDGWHDPATHAVAMGPDGCDTSRSVAFSQTDKFRDPTGNQIYQGYVKLRVKYYDGTVSNWWTKDVQSQT